MNLLKLDLQAGGARLSVHSGVGAGTLVGFTVGGLRDRWEYVITGDPISQIGSAEPEANAGETVISNAAYTLVSEHLEGTLLESKNFRIGSVKDKEFRKHER